MGATKPEIPEDGEGPLRHVKLRAFELETVTVTNERFAAFVAATGYVTDAERIGWAPVFRGLLSDPNRYPPSDSGTPWWAPVPGACWYAPEGAGSSLAQRVQHPVTQVSWQDASTFAKWVGGRLPTEPEWEHAARGGLDAPRFPWGDEEPTDDRIFCNIWQGRFPVVNTLADGFLGAAPVGSYPANGSGLFDMAGNVWQWTRDDFRIRSLSARAKDRNQRARNMQEKTLKGGSFLCHRDYCYRYRIAARMALPKMDCGSNTGFRVAYDR